MQTMTELPGAADPRQHEQITGKWEDLDRHAYRRAFSDFSHPHVPTADDLEPLIDSALLRLLEAPTPDARRVAFRWLRCLLILRSRDPERVSELERRGGLRR